MLLLLIATFFYTPCVLANEGSSLADAVSDFNVKASAKANGHPEPPLTEDEVIAAINGWGHRYGNEMDDSTLKRFFRICETKRLPPDAKLILTTNMTGYRNFDFDVWWIDLRLPGSPSSTHTIHIRQKWFASRKLTDAEIERRRLDNAAEAKRNFDPAR